ncbi:MAG: hypothetical protein OEW77_12660 [Gemmatimonadota bacterium]|nr:hypothetical protein [Gemmatimonadota bacterium]
MLRALSSIAIGFAVWTALFLGGNAMIARFLPGQEPGSGASGSGTGTLLLTLALSILFSIVAGWVTFKVDRVRALGSSLGLGATLLIIGVVVQYQYWDRMPLWYHLGFLGSLVPGVLLGYRLAVTRA